MTCLLSGELELLEPLRESEMLPDDCVRLSETDDPTELAARHVSGAAQASNARVARLFLK